MIAINERFEIREELSAPERWRKCNVTRAAHHVSVSYSLVIERHPASSSVIEWRRMSTLVRLRQENDRGDEPVRP
jgi:hypothetical protein